MSCHWGRPGQGGQGLSTHGSSLVARCLPVTDLNKTLKQDPPSSAEPGSPGPQFFNFINRKVQVSKMSLFCNLTQKGGEWKISRQQPPRTVA